MKIEDKANRKKQTEKISKKKVTNTNKKLTQKKKSKRRKKVIIILFLIIILAISIALILFSDLFNIKSITVTNNFKVDTTEIIQNSELEVGNNMFKTLNAKSVNQIKTNPYVEDVKITKKINGEVIIEVTERTTTFMLQCESGYAYINNQGYILENTFIPLEVPIIKGYSSTDLTPGNRLDVEDLKKLDIIIQIMEAAKSNGIKDIITTIDISDENNYILEIPSEAKTVQFGDKTNINVKILWIVDLISREKGIEGEIVLNVPDIKKVYFREKV